VQEMCLRALALLPGEVAEYRFWKTARVGGISRPAVARFAYVPELHWVVCVAQPEADLLAGVSELQALATWGMWLLLGVGLAGTGLAVRLWIKFSDNLADKLSSLLSNLANDAKELSAAAAGLSDEAARATGNTSAQDVLRKAGLTAEEIGLALSHIEASSHSVSGIIGAIDQIAFATNMFAVNAAIEASEADSGNKPIAGIADELSNLADRCLAAARNTQAELQQSRIELEKGNEEVLKLVRDLRSEDLQTPGAHTADPQSDEAGAALQRQARNLLRLAEEIGQSVENINSALNE